MVYVDTTVAREENMHRSFEFVGSTVYIGHSPFGDFVLVPYPKQIVSSRGGQMGTPPQYWQPVRWYLRQCRGSNRRDEESRLVTTTAIR